MIFKWELNNKEINILFFTVSKLYVFFMRFFIKFIDNFNFFVIFGLVGIEMCGLCFLIRRD